MFSQRSLLHAVAASTLLAVVGCGGTTQFAGAQAFAITGTSSQPPPPKPESRPGRVELRNNKIEIKEKSQFEVSKATIKHESDSLLKEIADVIKNNPQVKRISIEGHASAEGDPKRNKTLSEERAKAVMDFLVKTEGVDPSRLTSKGFGIERPIAPNDTEENREKNRRVDFMVTSQDVTHKRVEVDPVTGKERVVESKTEAVHHDDTSAKPSSAPPRRHIAPKPPLRK